MVYDLTGITIFVAFVELAHWSLWSPLTWGAIVAVFTGAGVATFYLTRG